MDAPTGRVTWAELPLGARWFRRAHGTWGAINLCGLAWIWRDALARRRDRGAYLATAVLFAEGVALVVGRGNCPFGPLQTRLGDPEPMFEWFLPPRAAKAAVPVLATVTIASLAAFAARKPRPA